MKVNYKFSRVDSALPKERKGLVISNGPSMMAAYIDERGYVRLFDSDQHEIPDPIIDFCDGRLLFLDYDKLYSSDTVYFPDLNVEHLITYKEVTNGNDAKSITRNIIELVNGVMH